MPAMRATVARRLNVAGTVYNLAAGDVVDVPAGAVTTMRAYGLVDVDDTVDPLGDVTVAELRERAKAAGIEGRSTMTKEELAQALRTTQEEPARELHAQEG